MIDNQLNGLVIMVEMLSDDIKMKFELDKCAKVMFRRCPKLAVEGIPLKAGQLIQDLDQAEAYKYQGMEEGEGVQNHRMEGKIKKEYNQWIKVVPNSTQCKEQDSSHQHPSSASSPLKL